MAVPSLTICMDYAQIKASPKHQPDVTIAGITKPALSA